MTLKHTLIALPLALGLSFTAHANLVTNAGFESLFTDWTVAGDTAIAGGAAHSETYNARIGGFGNLSSFSQTLATTNGASYDISFWLKEEISLTPNSFRVLWDGTPIASFTLTDVAQNLSWQQLSALAVVTATSNSAELTFEGTTPFFSGSFELDDISVTEVAPANTPEAPAVMMSLLGLAGLAAAKRQRRAI